MVVIKYNLGKFLRRIISPDLNMLNSAEKRCCGKVAYILVLSAESSLRACSSAKIKNAPSGASFLL